MTEDRYLYEIYEGSLVTERVKGSRGARQARTYAKLGAYGAKRTRIYVFKSCLLGFGLRSEEPLEGGLSGIWEL